MTARVVKYHSIAVLFSPVIGILLGILGAFPPLPLKADTKMKPTNLKQTNVAKPRKWFQRRRRWHDPMLVLNMSIFNFDGGWNRVFNPIPQRENVWG
jgi:hypothetical protein